MTGIDTASIARFYRFRFDHGSLRALGPDGAIGTRRYADSHHLAVGRPLHLTLPSGEQRTLRVRAVHHPRTPLLGDITMTQQAFDSGFTNPKNSLTFLDGNAKPQAVKSAVEGIGGARYHAGATFAEDSGKAMMSMLSMLYVLLGFSVLVSLFGMVNTLVLSVFERTREIGMLRTIGMTRKQARWLIRHESIITALIGAALGLGLGTALAFLLMAKWHMAISIPTSALMHFTVIAVLAGIGAAVMPARRASRLDVLEALSYE